MLRDLPVPVVMGPRRVRRTTTGHWETKTYRATGGHINIVHGCALAPIDVLFQTSVRVSYLSGKTWADIQHRSRV